MSLVDRAPQVNQPWWLQGRHLASSSCSRTSISLWCVIGVETLFVRVHAENHADMLFAWLRVSGAGRRSRSGSDRICGACRVGLSIGETIVLKLRLDEVWVMGLAKWCRGNDDPVNG